MTFRVKYDISGELVRHTGLTVIYWVTVTYCGPTIAALFLRIFILPSTTQLMYLSTFMED